MSEAADVVDDLLDPDFAEPTHLDPLRLELVPRKPQVFAGESIDVELVVGNPRGDASRELSAPETGNYAVRFVIEGEDGAELGPFDDGHASARRGEVPDTDFEPVSLTLEPDEERRFGFDLLPRVGSLGEGGWMIRAELSDELAEVEAEVEVDGTAPTPLLAAGTWDYDRGAVSLGFCAWTNTSAQHTGTYLRFRSPRDPGEVAANRRISEEVATSGLRVARCGTFEARRRHVLWDEGPDGATRVVVLQDEWPAGEHVVEGEGRVRDAWTDARGDLILVRASDSDLWVERRSGHAPGEGPVGRVDLGPGLWAADASLSLWGSCFGPLWVGWHVGTTLRLRCVGLGEGTRLEPLAELERELPGAPGWLELRRGPEDQRGDQVQVLALGRPTPTTGALVRWVCSEDELEDLAEGDLPTGAVHDASLGRRLQVLISTDTGLTQVPLPGVPHKLSEAYSPAVTQFVRSSASSGGALYLRRAGDEGGFAFDAVEE